MSPDAAPRGRDPSPERMEKYRRERDEILRAAFGLIGRDSGESVSVQEILEASGLSTRAFYRHFRSKDELILTMYRTAAERVAGELARVVAEADGPVDALAAWIRQQLAVAFDSRRARQTSVLSSVEARSASGFERVHEDATDVRRRMLADVIREGQRTHAFPGATDPEQDARAVLSVLAGVIEARVAGRGATTWEAAASHTTGLFLRAFGAA